jgi:taurine dioxygenase
VSSAALSVDPVSGFIGAEVDMDLSRPFDEDTREALNDALDEHHVLFFRDQNLDPTSLKRVTEAFAPLMRVPYITPSPEDPDIIAVLKEASEEKIANFGGDWHSDFSFLDAPPGGSVLYALEIPPYGGDTMWASQAAAYERLSENLKKEIEGKRAIHIGAPYGAKSPPKFKDKLSASIAMTRGDPEADRQRLHPIVRTHPRSGRKGLFVNPIYTVGIEGMEPGDAKHLLSRLYRHATRPDLTCRFRWAKGSVAIWDNRMTMHYALNDYDGHRRLLWRTTFAGERPV